MKKKFEFPSAYSVMIIVMILVAGLTFLVPAGKYAKLAYNADSNVFVLESPNGETKDLPATQETLDKLGINANLEKFTDGSIGKPVGVPGSYEKVKSNPQGLEEILKAPIKGLYDTIDIMAFVLVIGGLVGIVNNTGSFTAGIATLSRRLKGKELWLIVIITTLISIGGTTFGLAEETIAFYPIIVPIFIAAGYDAIVAIASIYLGSCIGTLSSTVNPFSTIIASDTAGINWTTGIQMRFAMLIIGTIICIMYIIRYAEKVKKDPTKSLIYDQKEEIEARFLSNDGDGSVPEFTGRRKLILAIFGSAFAVMVWGVSKAGWWFEEMTALFLAITLIVGVLAQIKEKEFVSEFVQGASELLGVALLIGIARGVTIIMDSGLISDTILYSATGLIKGMGAAMFSTTMFFIYSVLGFFIASSSGLAVLSMPIMAPLADVVGVGREVIVNAYQYGQGLISFITPTGLILASLAMVNVTYDKWLKFVMPLVGIIAGLSIVMLAVGTML